MRTASTAVKPCQEDSYEFYLFTDSIIGVATMYQRSQIHYRILILELQNQSFNIKIVDTKLPQRSSKSNQEPYFG
ncbi:hypothetical protein Tco_1459788 [Tanacetum coccineum]